jgi:hypothetical protein
MTHSSEFLRDHRSRQALSQASVILGLRERASIYRLKVTSLTEACLCTQTYEMTGPLIQLYGFTHPRAGQYSVSIDGSSAQHFNATSPTPISNSTLVSSPSVVGIKNSQMAPVLRVGIVAGPAQSSAHEHRSGHDVRVCGLHPRRSSETIIRRPRGRWDHHVSLWSAVCRSARVHHHPAPAPSKARGGGWAASVPTPQGAIDIAIPTSWAV